jgi:osmotically-inducible protein OsmY
MAGIGAAALLALSAAACTAAHNTVEGAGAVATGAVEHAGGATTDASIKLAIEGKMVQDPVVKSREVDVHADRGLVTLEGVQPSWEARRRVEQIAWSVGGVRGVVNDINVVPPGG